MKAGEWRREGRDEDGLYRKPSGDFYPQREQKGRAIAGGDAVTVKKPP